MEGERKERAKMEVLYDRIMKRVLKLEELLGAVNNKPQMIVDLEDSLVWLRSEIFRDVSDCKLGVQYSVDE